jgi:hypothetical protein
MPSELVPYRWFGRDRPLAGWDSCPAADPGAWGLPAPPAPAFGPVPGPWPDATSLWRALGAADAEGAGQGRCVAVPRASFQSLAAQFSAAAGQTVTAGAVAARWASELQLAAAVPPGQPRPDASPTLAELAELAEAGASGWTAFLSDQPLPLRESVEVPAPGAAWLGEVAVEGGLVVARVRCEGPCWLMSAAPFPYYEPVLGALPQAPALPAGLVGWWFDRDPVEAFPEVARQIPRGPARWRTDFWLGVLGRVTPGAVAWAVGADHARIALLAEALAGTRLFAPLLAAVGERVLLTAVLEPAEVLGWLQASPEALAPAQRAAVLALQARGLDDLVGVELWMAGRDLLLGRLDPAHPLVERHVRKPLREALLRELPEVEVVSVALARLWGAGGPDAVRDVLDGLVAEGITTAGELGELAELAPAAHHALSAWLGRAG